MGHWLATGGAAARRGFVKRFDPRFWTVDFPRPMMACATTIAADALRVDAVFYRKSDLAGLIWEAEDRHDHPLLAYETARDFRRCALRFRWRSSGLVPLDAVSGPTLTIEGRDEGGSARAWYVRLWNHADGTGEDALVTLDFAALAGGWEGEDPVWAGDVDRMFVSLVAPGYDGTDAPLAAPAEGWAELSGMSCDGSGSVLGLGDVLVPGHRLRIATGYDDLYHLTPERVLRMALGLGYRGALNHYVGMSHYFRLEALGGGHYVSLAGGVLNGPCAAWHRDFAARAGALGFSPIFSLSYELLDQHCWNDWKQRELDGAPALTSWAPPSALLSPAHEGAMGYLRLAARAFAAILRDAGLPVRFQVGEPWWWVTEDGGICLYDAAAVAAFAPAAIADVTGPLNAAQEATLDAAGACLAASTAALCAAVREEDPEAECLLLVYLPSVLAAPEIARANVPLGWAVPSFDALQLEDYDWTIAGRSAGAGVAAMAERLGYPVAEQHYFAGFVQGGADTHLWPRIAAAVEAAFERGTAETFVWALPQVMRDGFVHFDPSTGSGQAGGHDMEAFADVRFPIALGREASVAPAFSTAIVETAGGAERRNSEWADARLGFDAGPGLRGEEDVQNLLAFFRARRGAAQGFRIEDPFDNSSNGMSLEPGAADQLLGVGDGVRTEFPLIKAYGGQVRRITRPVAGTVRVSVGGAEMGEGWSLAGKGVVAFDDPPGEGAEVRAGFRFDVPVRFAEDRLELNRATFLAGELPSVPMIEVRE
jgi:uncharacterized protein (TIGR02217 family)